jgi:copper resistance protein C
MKRASFCGFYRQGMTIVFVFWIGMGLAYAHAVVIESTPKNGETLFSPPTEIVLRFNAKIEKALARVSLATSDGKTVLLPEAAVRRNTEAAPDCLVIQLPLLVPGTYLLRYKVLATDGHATLGELRFTITGRTSP